MTELHRRHARMRAIKQLATSRVVAMTELERTHYLIQIVEDELVEMDLSDAELLAELFPQPIDRKESP